MVHKGFCPKQAKCGSLNCLPDLLQQSLKTAVHMEVTRWNTSVIKETVVYVGI